ncbi:MAG: acyltransferase family protein [Lachnospiraceae bacterium]|nr:acyltransferase family protein [Lachnospiraceae bacterium]
MAQQQSGQRSKSNKKFMVLSAIGIFMVVDQHTFTALNILGDFIPYNSFFMPMFMFISGYFNKVDASTNLWQYLKKKVKTLLVPFFGIATFVLLMEQLMDWYKNGVHPQMAVWYVKYMLAHVVTVGAPFPMVTPMWFVITLFATLMVYAVAKRLLAKLWNSYVFLAIFIALHILTIYLARAVSPEALTPFLLPLKVLFFLPFLELGVIYRERLEGAHAKLSGGLKVGLLAVLLFINMVRTVVLPTAYDVAFDSINDLSGFKSPFVVTPLISSLIGIAFWLTLVDLIGKPVYESRFVNYMSCNTFWIMGMHIMFFNLLNCVLLLVNNHVVALPYFDAAGFLETEWYYWELSPNLKLAYVFVGILGPLGLKFLWDKVISFLKTRIFNVSA